MSEIRVLAEFRKQLTEFLDELIEMFPMEGDLVVVRLFIDTRADIQGIASSILHKINTNDGELRKMIQERNEKFFLEHNMFDSLGKDKVNHFKRLWLSGTLEPVDKETIWNWIDAFVSLSDWYSAILSKKVAIAI